MTFDGKAFGRQIVEAVKTHVAAVLEPIERRLKAVEDRQPEKGEQGPQGEPGRDGADGAPGADGNDGRDGEKGDPGRDGADGKDGVDGAPGEAGPSGEKGEPGDAGAPGERGEKGERGADGKDGAPGADGIGLADALIDKDGQLVLTMTNGQTKTLGTVVGRNGVDGKDGAKGEPGRDGFGLEEFDASLMDDGRTVLLSFSRGEHAVKVELGIPAMIYRGVFKEGTAYVRGDTVTFGGSLWHCDEPTEAKPGDGVKSWTLAAKRGRDGKPGKDGTPPKAPEPIKLGGKS